MRRVVLMLSLAALATAATATGAAAHDSLRVSSAVVRADQGVLELAIGCRAPRVRCTGRLTVNTIDESPFTVARDVTLAPGLTRRLSLRLRRTGLKTLSDAGAEKLLSVALRAPGAHHPVRGYAVVRARVSCHTGTTLVTTPAVRVFRLQGFGLYACSDPHTSPDLVFAENTGFEQAIATNVAAAGAFVTYTYNGGGGKCGASSIFLYDLRAHRTVRQIGGANVIDGAANGCTGVAAILAAVVRPSGALAWIEGPGDAGQATVRAADPDGTLRTLDTSAAIDPTSLRLIDPVSVGWTRAGIPQTSPLP